MTPVAETRPTEQRFEETEEQFLAAIHEIENPRNSTQPGGHGELGPYQFRKATWEQHTKLPFEQWATHPLASSLIAKAHYEWLYAQLVRHGVKPTVFALAACWNSGLEGFLSDRYAYDYPTRVANLCR